MDFTIADVLAWARTKPADEEYSFECSATCALAQFGLATGREHLAGWQGTHIIFDWPELHGALNAGDNYTFGGLVARLEALCPDQIVTPSEWTKLDAYLTDIEQVSA
jgi:hypothetical protein